MNEALSLIRDTLNAFSGKKPSVKGEKRCLAETAGNRDKAESRKAAARKGAAAREEWSREDIGY